MQKISLSLVLLGLGLAACDKDKDNTDDTGDDAALTDADEDGFDASVDCDDNDASINPDADETCDGIDNNCDGDVDSGTGLTIYLDVDGDGYGLEGSDAESCDLPEGYVDQGQDCNDQNAKIYPGATELCNGLDDNCDGAADNNPADAIEHFEDLDGDGYGTTSTSTFGCFLPAGRVENDGDCDDADRNLNPGAPELCNGGIDDDCDPKTDEAGSVSFWDRSKYTSLTEIFDSGTASYPARYFIDKPGELIFCGGSWKGALWIDADVTITGIGGSSDNILDAAEDFPSILIGDNARNVSIEGVTFKGGDSNIVGYQTRSGGGLYCNKEAVIDMTDVVIKEANAGFGGGMYIDGDCDVTMTDSVLTENNGGVGGAVAIFKGSLSMYNSEVSKNSGGSQGGGLYVYAVTGDVDVLLEDTIVSENTSSSYSAMYMYNSSSYDANVTCRATTKGSGGFINHSTTSGAAIYLYMYYAYSSTFTSEGCDFGSDTTGNNNSPYDIYQYGYGTNGYYDFENEADFSCSRTTSCN